MPECDVVEALSPEPMLIVILATAFDRWALRAGGGSGPGRRCGLGTASDLTSESGAGASCSRSRTVEVDLTQGDVERYLLYHAPISLAIEGLDASCPTGIKQAGMRTSRPSCMRRRGGWGSRALQ